MEKKDKKECPREDRQLLKRIYNIDKRIQHFFDSEYDYRTIEIEFDDGEIERKVCKKSNSMLNSNGNASKPRKLRDKTLKNLNNEMKKIKREISRIDKKVKTQRCSSSTHLFRL